MTVSELMQQASGRVQGAPACSIFEALRGVLRIIENRMLFKRSELIQENLAVTYEAGSTAPLPTEFLATSELPRLSGSLTGNLFPLPTAANKTTTSMTTAGTPMYYEIKGHTLHMYPPAVANGSLVVPAYTRLDVPTALTDTVPLWGMMDDVVLEGCVALMTGGLAMVRDAAFAAVIESQVDHLLLAKTAADEQVMADCINRGGGF